MERQKSSRIVSGRINRIQKKRLMQIMKQHPLIGKGQFKQSYCSRTRHVSLWDTVANELNALGDVHHKKTSDQWRKCWIDWKYAVKKQYTKYKEYDNHRNDFPEDMAPKPLSVLDCEMLDFFSADENEEATEFVTVPTEEIDTILSVEEDVELSRHKNPDILYDESNDRASNNRCTVDEVDDTIQSQEEVKFSPDLLHDERNERASTNCSTVAGAIPLSQSPNEIMVNLLEKQHREHMSALKSIETTMKEILQAVNSLRK